MALQKLEITNFRNLESVKIKPVNSGFNFFYGNNGSGKTSILEAIYYLTRGRSFRGSLANRIIRHETDKFSIFSEIKTPLNQLIPVGLERQRHGDTTLRIAGQSAESIADITQLLPTLLINSYCYSILDAGPVFRRKFLDWGAFYLNKGFLPVWKQYERALKQRNAALRKQASKKELESWTAEVIQHGAVLHEMRQSVVLCWLPIMQEIVSELLNLSNLDISYQSGWHADLSYEAALNQSFDKDMSLGFTHLGPHRCDIKITLNRVPARDILSRGQQKLFVCAMILAQGALLFQSEKHRPIYLVDDLPSELDANSRASLIALLSKQEAQVYLTAVEHEVIEFKQAPYKMFHVEHGNLTEMSG